MDSWLFLKKIKISIDKTIKMKYKGVASKALYSKRLLAGLFKKKEFEPDFIYFRSVL